MTDIKIRDLSISDKEKLQKYSHLRTKPMVYTRTMGYYRPVESFNKGKQGEHAERKCFEENNLKNNIV